MLHPWTFDEEAQKWRVVVDFPFTITTQQEYDQLPCESMICTKAFISLKFSDVAQRNLIGVEVELPLVGKLCYKLYELEVKNNLIPSQPRKQHDVEDLPKLLEAIDVLGIDEAAKRLGYPRTFLIMIVGRLTLQERITNQEKKISGVYYHDTPRDQ